MIFCVRSDLKLLRQIADPFATVSQLQGPIFRQVANRHTLRFESHQQGYFLKYHRGIGWREAIKNWLTLKVPILGASNEWQAINKLAALAIPSLTPVAYGEKGWWPLQKNSFLITEELTATENLETLAQHWQQHPEYLHLKRYLIQQLAEIARRIHQAGMNHRDFYICHFLVKAQQVKAFTKNTELPVYLIDLHRVQIRDKVPPRWLIKDIGSLYFSVMHLSLTKTDKLRFVKAYSPLSLRHNLTVQQTFWQRVQRRANKLYYKAHGKLPLLQSHE